MLSTDVMSLKALIVCERLILLTLTPVLPCVWTRVISIIWQVLGDFLFEVTVLINHMICQVSEGVACFLGGYVFATIGTNLPVSLIMDCSSDCCYCSLFLISRSLGSLNRSLSHSIIDPGRVLCRICILINLHLHRPIITEILGLLLGKRTNILLNVTISVVLVR